MEPTKDDVNLSFLSPIPSQLQPYVFELKQVLPGKIYVKWMYVEAYEALQSHQLRELDEKGWHAIEPDNTEQSTLFLILSSHIGFTIAALNNTTPTLYVRAQDLACARDYPVLLVTDITTQVKNDAEAIEGAIGSQAIIFDGPHALYSYQQKQLPPAGKALWNQLQSMLQPHEEPLNLSRLEKGSRRFALRDRMLALSDIAKELAKAYYQLHQAKPGKRYTMPKSLPHQQSILANASRIPESHALEAALLAMSNAVEGARGWKKHRTLGPVFTHDRQGSSSAAVSIQASTELATKKDITKQIWKQVSEYSDLDGDVLLAMLAQMTLVGSNQQGATWITAEEILSYRGIAPKQDANHRPEDIRAIAACVERLRSTHVSVSMQRAPKRPGAKPRALRRESFLLLIKDYLVPDSIRREERELKDAIAWLYLPGDSLEVPVSGHMQKKAAWLFQKALEYDPYHQKWEKRLARYFMFHLRIGTNIFGGSTMRRTIGTLLTENSLDVNTHNPIKTMTRFEEAMHILQQDGHITSWNEPEYQAHRQSLPVRQWLPIWLEHELEISASPLSPAIDTSKKE